MTNTLIDMAKDAVKNGMTTVYVFIERAYCLICRKEIMTESGQLCTECGKKAKE